MMDVTSTVPFPEYVAQDLYSNISLQTLILLRCIFSFCYPLKHRWSRGNVGQQILLISSSIPNSKSVVFASGRGIHVTYLPYPGYANLRHGVFQARPRRCEAKLTVPGLTPSDIMLLICLLISLQ